MADTVIAEESAGTTAVTNRGAMLAAIDRLHEVQAEARAGGGAKYVERHRSRGRLLARERIDLLVDRDAAFLELSTVAGWGSEFHVGGSLITGIGVVEGVECMLVANDPTIRGGASNPYTWTKIVRAMEIARTNRLPVINLVESGGADLPSQADFFVRGGALFRDLTRMSADGVPSISLVFGNSTAGGAYVPGMSDYSVMVREQAKVFLGGPPLVQMATGEISTDEELGGAEMHSRVSGLSDYLADNEHEAIRIGRQIVATINWRKLGARPALPIEEPVVPVEGILDVISHDLRAPFDPRDVLKHVLDGSRFDEYKPAYGTSLVTGWGSIHGFRVGILANANGVIFPEEAEKATEFILLANQIDVPLIFMQNTTGFIVGKVYEQAGMIKDGAKMINAVSNSSVPHITLLMGSSYGAGNYGMSGRAFEPRLMFSWPNAKTAVMGAPQLAGVMSLVGRSSAANSGREFDVEADAARRVEIEAQISRESDAFYMSGKLNDDGIIDPRDTRTVLGISLSAIHSNVVEGRRGFGVFRM